MSLSFQEWQQNFDLQGGSWREPAGFISAHSQATSWEAEKRTEQRAGSHPSCWHLLFSKHFSIRSSLGPFKSHKVSIISPRVQRKTLAQRGNLTNLRPYSSDTVDSDRGSGSDSDRPSSLPALWDSFKWERHINTWKIPSRSAAQEFAQFGTWWMSHKHTLWRSGQLTRLMWHHLLYHFEFQAIIVLVPISSSVPISSHLFFQIRWRFEGSELRTSVYEFRETQVHPNSS